MSKRKFSEIEDDYTCMLCSGTLKFHKQCSKCKINMCLLEGNNCQEHYERICGGCTNRCNYCHLVTCKKVDEIYKHVNYKTLLGLIKYKYVYMYIDSYYACSSCLEKKNLSCDIHDKPIFCEELSTKCLMCFINKNWNVRSKVSRNIKEKVLGYVGKIF